MAAVPAVAGSNSRTNASIVPSYAGCAAFLVVGRSAANVIPVRYRFPAVSCFRSDGMVGPVPPKNVEYTNCSEAGFVGSRMLMKALPLPPYFVCIPLLVVGKVAETGHQIGRAPVC